jgi:glutathione S-transferase
MITIYHAPNTRGFRNIWLCEELGLDYQVERVDFSAAYRDSADWRRMNPVGKVPVMTDGEVKLFESGAIVQHLLDCYGEGRLQPPRGTHEHGLFLQWCWFAEATFSRATGELANHKRAFAGALLEPVMKEMRGRARTCMQALDDAVRDKQFLLGDAFTAADVMMGYCLLSYERNVGDAIPDCAAAYWQGLQARPTFDAAIAANRMGP